MVWTSRVCLPRIIVCHPHRRPGMEGLVTVCRASVLGAPDWSLALPGAPPEDW